MKILVTGGAGFLGSHLVDELVRRHEVVVLDNLSTGRQGWINPKAKLATGDVRDLDTVEAAMSGCKAVFHLAAQTDVRKSQEDPEFDYEANVVGSQRVFQAAQREGAKVVFASSAAVYGNALPPVAEDAPLNPISQYGWNKLQAERIAPADSFIARIFNAYGSRGRGAINAFCSSALKGEEAEIRGTGLQTRDWVYVDDIVAALLLGLNTKGIFNVGTGRETTLLAALHIAEKMAGKEVGIKFVPGIAGEISRSAADIRKIKEEIGWSPRVSLEEGVRRILRALS
jgi:UDP-glucose 4-epimerase